MQIEEGVVAELWGWFCDVFCLVFFSFLLLLQAHSCMQSIHLTKEWGDTHCAETGEATGGVTAEQLFVRAYNAAKFWQCSAQ